MSSDSGSNFLKAIIEDDLAHGRVPGGLVVTRFPPEPNGYLHIGHAKAICVDFGMAELFGGRCHLRMDDTNPETEDRIYVEAIERDVRWLGFDWGPHLTFASDYFERLYACAVRLIRMGKAYVDDLSLEEIRRMRGTVTTPGTPSPYRDRSVEENLDLFARMRAGEFEDGSRVLRARIDMASPNMKMRDPLLYRVRRARHYRRGDDWCIYPMYDFAHCLSDAFEGVTHSFCTLEFENNREVYDWILDTLGFAPRPHQYEMARLNLTTVMTSKRRLKVLVDEGHVGGWDDPRMPTLAGLRRRGVPPEAIRAFVDRVGVSRTNSVVDHALFEATVRDWLDPRVPRLMGVLDPVELVLENWPEGRVDHLDAPLHPHDVPREGSRIVPFGRRLLVERSDFRVEPPRRWRRLAPGREVRLRYAYLLTCTGYERDPGTGRIARIFGRIDPDSRGGRAPDGRRVRGTIHWVSAEHGVRAEVRVVEPLFTVDRPDEVEDFRAVLNPDALRVYRDAVVEPEAAARPVGDRFQLERLGYFHVDPDTAPGAPVFQRIVALRSSYRPDPTPVAPGSGSDAPGGAVAPAPGAERRSAAPKGASDPPGLPPAGSPALERERAGLLEQGIGPQEAAVLTARPDRLPWYRAAVAAGADPHEAARWVAHRVVPAVEQPLDRLPVGGEALAALLRLVANGRITSGQARKALSALLVRGGSPEEVVESLGFQRPADSDELDRRIAEVLAAHPEQVAAWREGRRRVEGFLVGQVLRALAGAAEPREVARRVREALEASG